MKIWSIFIMFFMTCGFMGCTSPERNFAEDLAFLKRYKEVLLLEDGDAKVIVVPAYQGRVMTSTFDGLEGESLGWVNYDLIASGEIKPHINVFGGEDRIWLGPEGGQFALFFKPGDEFTLKDWQTPALIDTAPFPVIKADKKSIMFKKEASLANYSGTKFDLRLRRTLRLLSKEDVEKHLGMTVGGSVKMVAYESENTLTNTGASPWSKKGGLPSIWILGMYKHSPSMTVVVPYRQGPETDLGPIVNDAYFGKVPGDRLVVGDKAIFFKGDGKYRSKIGVTPMRAKPFVASYDGDKNILTLVHYNQPEGVTDYVNSMWKIQKNPFAGDVVNSYNDGPPSPGAKPLGPFYELETSSPAAQLNPGKSITHFHRTLHLKGPFAELDGIAQKVLGVGLVDITKALSSSLEKKK